MKKIFMFAIVLAAVGMISCAGNANKPKAAAHECTEQCEEGKCTKPIEEQCEKCKAATEAAAAAAACQGEKACEKACEGKEHACKGDHKDCQKACDKKEACKGEQKACDGKHEHKCDGCKAE